MQVFCEQQPIADLENISDQGDGYTSWEMPSSSEEFDLESFGEMFSKWSLI